MTKEIKETDDCPLCNCKTDKCVCGLTALVELGVHHQGELCCIPPQVDGLHTFVLIIDKDGVTEIHNFLKSNLATVIIFNCQTAGMEEAFKNQCDMARKHAKYILQPPQDTVE